MINYRVTGMGWRHRGNTVMRDHIRQFGGPPRPGGKTWVDLHPLVETLLLIDAYRILTEWAEREQPTPRPKRKK